MKRIERQLPNDINAESAVISAMMIDSEAVAKAIEILEENDFYRTAHQVIFKEIVLLFEQNIEIDIITLINALKKSGKLEVVGGKVFINEISDVVISSANIEFHAAIVKEKAVTRKLIVASNRIIEKCYGGELEADELLDESERIIFGLSQYSIEASFKSSSDVVSNAIQNIETIAAQHSPVIGVPSGFTDLDKIIGGFNPGKLIVLASRPSMGKTSLVLNMAIYAAIAGKKVGFFTMEMSSTELMIRALSSEGEVDLGYITRGYLNEEKIRKIASNASVISDCEFYIDDTGFNTPLSIKAKSRRLKAKIKGVDLLIIDYLQLMTSSQKAENRQQEIAIITRTLKLLAKELDVPVILISQLNRSLENRPDKHPRLADLRESGAIEQDADIVMFLYRDEVYDENTEKPGIAELIIAKNRDGPIGKLELLWQEHIVKFKNIANYEE